MKLGPRHAMFGAVAATLLCLGPIGYLAGQATQGRPATPATRPAAPAAATANKPLLAEQVYHNIQVLKGMPVDQFIDTMGFIASSMGANCVFCHDDAIGSADPSRHHAFELETKPNMKTARQMIVMTRAINKNYFAGANVLTCFTCHRGDEDPPAVIPQMWRQYAAPVDEEPDQFPKQADNAPAPATILSKYVQAIGGAQRLAGLKSYTIQGTYSGYDTDLTPVPMNIYAKAPAERTRVMHTPFGDRLEVFNGTEGWNAVPDTSEPRPVLPITGGRLTSTKILSELAFPGQINNMLTRWVSNPETISGAEPGAQNVKDRDVWVVQGVNEQRLPVKLYFDKQNGYLLRVVSYINTAIGLIPAQIDYSGFRNVNGITWPMHWVETWTDGQSIYNVTQVNANAAVDDALFKEPAAPKALKPRANVPLAPTPKPKK